jgi:tripartite-type tricarboxylate transporter receptor subunit TctC
MTGFRARRRPVGSWLPAGSLELRSVALYLTGRPNTGGGSIDMKRLLTIAIVAGSVMPAPGAHAAETFPNRPLRMIIPFPPGGGTDIMGRIVAQRLSDALGMQVVVDNRGGAGGLIGTEMATRAAPDGHTLMIGSVSTICINPSLHKNLTFDPGKDLTPISLVASTPSVLVVGSSQPVKSVKELIALAKAQPGKLTYATPGSGSSSHLGTELFKQAAGVDILHVPYKGTGPAITDVASGQVTMFISNMPSVLPMVKAGRLRPLAVTSLQRSALEPDLPTIAESGVKDFELIVWYGLLAPKGLPAPILNRLNQEIRKMSSLPEIRQRLAAQGAEVVTNSPDEFARQIAKDRAKWELAVKLSGATPQ